jgi:cytochrome c biogenesis protein CcmG/thiol:disulfide interchange protein DsbE
MGIIRKTALLIFLFPMWACVGHQLERAHPPALAITVGAHLDIDHLQLLDGEIRPLVTDDHRATLLTVWATWCQYCKAEIPNLKAFYQDQPPAGIEIVAVNTGESARRINAFLAENKLPYLIAVDPEQRILARLKEQALPAILLVDRKGIVRFMGNHLPKDPAELDRALNSD